ncbi:MAG: IS4/Tn5 family transposase DNA-binding protein, partial [Enterovibrio sp.]
MFLTDAEQWATKTFSQADRGDLRRTKRLVKFTASLADHIGQSIVQSLKSPSDIEAAYRFTRNQAIDAQSIAQAGFAATAELSHAYDCLLVLEDTTSLNFTHRTVRDEMGYTSSKKSATGMQAHSVLLFAPNEEQVVGLIEQERWVRNKKEAEKQSCETLLSPVAWKLLWSKQEKTRPPKKAPSVYWAYISLGKLAGWYDSK